MFTLMVLIILSLFLLLLMVALDPFSWRSNRVIYTVYDPVFDDEVVTTHHTTATTTTTTVDNPVPVMTAVAYVGNLTIKRNENGQPYVNDPVDNMVWFLNETDDQYEDAEGKMWKLV